jgi:hypothetical protein
LECSHVHVQLPRELIERQELVLLLVINDRCAGTPQNDCEATRRPLSHGR